MAGLLGEVRRLNGIGDRASAEPFAGGAGASLSLLYLEETPEIYINDADRAIHDLWWTAVHRPRPLIEMISRTRVSLAEWRRQRDVYRNPRGVSRLRRGFAAFYLNRCNRSGIIMNGGPIGGIGQTGAWKLNARFNKSDLRCRFERIAEYHDRIHVSCMDGLDFIEGLDPAHTFYFIDPPYYTKGKTLYLNSIDANYHANLADHLRSMTDAAWVLTYDDCPHIRKMYRGWATMRPFGLRYAASERRRGKELFITPKWMQLPAWQTSAAITW